MTTDRTVQRERLIATIRDFDGPFRRPYPETYSVLLADVILVEFPDLAQQPRLDPALREQLNIAHNRGFSMGWEQGLLEIARYATEEADTEASDRKIITCDSIAPAAQPQIDREALAKLIQEGLRRDMNLGSISALDCADYVIAHLNAAPAAQPLPTMTEIEQVWENDSATRACNQNTKYVFSRALRCAGLVAREDEPEPQVGEVAYTPEAERLGEAVWDSYGYITNTPVLWDELDSIEKEKWAYVGQYMIDNHALALAKAVSEGGGS